MKVFEKVQQTRRALKNVGRMREIVQTMTRYGFSAFVHQLKLDRFAIRKETREELRAQRKMSTAERVRRLFEELGPTFIKIGQILAGRPDLVPTEYVKEFSKLQAHVAPVSFDEIKPIVEEDLGMSVSDAFLSFDPIALASASIAQVHVARTHEGDDVVVKILKPNVEDQLNKDLEILEIMSELAESYVDELRPFRPSMIVREIKRNLLKELRFDDELSNMEKFSQNFRAHPFLVVPRPFKALSSRKVLTMQHLHGRKIQEVIDHPQDESNVDGKNIIKEGIDCFLESILVHGFFHADPHGGNILILEDQRLGLLDFGSVAWLSPRSKEAVVNMFLALVTQDFESLILEYLYLSPPSPGSRSSTRIDELQKEVSQVFSPYYGRELKDIPAGELLLEATSIAFKHRIVLPQDLVMVFKSIMTMEGIGRALDPEFDLLSSGNRFAKLVIRNQYQPARLAKEAFLILRDVKRFLRNSPRLVGESLRQFESGEATINLIHKENHLRMRQQADSANRIAIAIVFSALLAASYFAHVNFLEPVWLKWTLWILTVVLLLVFLSRLKLPPSQGRS